MLVPELILRQLYSFGSLKNTENGIQFNIKNRLSDAQLLEISKIVVTGQEISLEKVILDFGDGVTMSPLELKENAPLAFPLRETFDVLCQCSPLLTGQQSIELEFTTSPFGTLHLKVEGHFEENKEKSKAVPRHKKKDYSTQAIQERHEFIKEQTGTKLQHISQFSFEGKAIEGNCEQFIGVAQVPMGLAGPLKIKGEHAQGEFYIPLATSEGTLVASYNRGMKLINKSGGVTCTIQDDAMQRAPVFVFKNARDARDFSLWLKQKESDIKQAAETTTSRGKMTYIDIFLASKMVFLRFNFTTGDAAGQNMVSKATFAACTWILEQYKERKVVHFYLESNMATDKKASQINLIRTRGKRVTAECVIPKDILGELMRVSPEQISYHSQIANVGAILSGANNNGLHAANGITAMFIATGQDVANVSEASAGIIHVETTPEGDLYMSITLPSLIVATHGGGTSLPTQKEALEIMDCYGSGKVNKLAEVVAGVVLAGELSLACAISSSDWVSSHEHYGRNK